jgi:streptomycin 6-kinase
MLLERLGRPLSALGYSVERQIDVLAETLAQAWRPAPESMELRTGAEQAAFLAPFVRSRWERLDQPCPEPVIERAEAFARSRRDAFDPTTAVLVHGDAHADNVLEDGRGGFKLIDPEGLRSERAHDLAMQLRDWTEELLAGADPAATGLEWCRRLGERTGVDPQPIWEWAYLERVSSGLFLLELGDPSGVGFLRVAEQWVDARP